MESKTTLLINVKSVSLMMMNQKKSEFDDLLGLGKRSVRLKSGLTRSLMVICAMERAVGCRRQQNQR